MAPKTLHHYGNKRTSREEWAKTIRTSREAFTAGRMNGRVFDPELPQDYRMYGDLPEPYKSLLSEGSPDYVVYSYGTPIAWHDSATDRWTVPDVNYSLTTTGHQHTVRMAVDTWDGERWQHDYDSGPYVNLRAGKGKSPYGQRVGY